jgi:quercetin dioxygenase-like cupin family protein
MRDAPTVALLMLLPAAMVLAACDDQGTTSPASGSITDPTAVAPNLSDAPAPIAIELLSGRQQAFTDAVAIQIRDKPANRPTAVSNLQDGSHIVVLRITVQPGARFPWHTHPASVLVAVTTGELTFVYADDCVERIYPAGTAFVDPGFENVHVAFNDGDVEAVLIATFLGAPAAGPLTLAVEAGVAEELDAKCGFAPASSHTH